jgi:hypothetical protein
MTRPISTPLKVQVYLVLILAFSYFSSIYFWVFDYWCQFICDALTFNLSGFNFIIVVLKLKNKISKRKKSNMVV